MACRRANGLGAGKRSTTPETGQKSTRRSSNHPKAEEATSPTPISSPKKRKERVGSTMYAQHFKGPQVELRYQPNAFTVVAPVQTLVHCARHRRYTSSHIMSAAEHSRRLVQNHPSWSKAGAGEGRVLQRSLRQSQQNIWLDRPSTVNSFPLRTYP